MLRSETLPRKGADSDEKLVREKFSDKLISKKRPGRNEGEAMWLAGRIAFQAEGNTGKKTRKWGHASQVQGTAKRSTCLEQRARRIVVGKEPSN